MPPFERLEFLQDFISSSRGPLGGSSRERLRAELFERKAQEYGISKAPQLKRDLNDPSGKTYVVYSESEVPKGTKKSDPLVDNPVQFSQNPDTTPSLDIPNFQYDMYLPLDSPFKIPLLLRYKLTPPRSDGERELRRTNDEFIDCFPYSEEEGYESSNFVFSGPTKGGKSTAVEWFLLYHTLDRKIFEFGIVFSSTTEFNNEYSYLPSNTVRSGYSPEGLRSWFEDVRQMRKSFTKKTMPRSFILFEDLLGYKNFNVDNIADIIATARHFGISLIFTFQKVKGFAKPILRNNTKWWFLFRNAQSDDTKSLHGMVGSRIVKSPTAWVNWFDYIITQIPYSFLVVDATPGPIPLEESVSLCKIRKSLMPKVRIMSFNTQGPERGTIQESIKERAVPGEPPGSQTQRGLGSYFSKTPSEERKGREPADQKSTEEFLGSYLDQDLAHATSVYV